MRPKKDRSPLGYWQKIPHQRKLFEEFAKQQGFDPLNAAYWRTIKRAQIESVKVWYHFIVVRCVRIRTKYIAVSFREAMQYCDITRKILSRHYVLLSPRWTLPSKAKTITLRWFKRLLHAVIIDEKDPWRDPQKCRVFFDDLAKSTGIDPLLTEQWYSINFKKEDACIQNKKIRKLFGSWPAALAAAYPELTFEPEWLNNWIQYRAELRKKAKSQHSD